MAIAMILSLLPVTAFAAEGTFSGAGNGTSASPYEVATAAQLNEVRGDLDAHYILTADIDLSSYTNWEPIGTFVPVSDEDPETPRTADAFSGSFDGKNHTVSGLKIARNDGVVVALFGCTANATVKDLILTEANVTGNMMVAAGIGYAFKTTVDNLDLAGANAISGKNIANGYPANMLAGTVGAAIDLTIKNCDITGTASARTTVTAETDAQNVGLIGGGLEGGTMSNCTVTGGTVTTGNNSIGIGGLTGCAMEFDSISGSSVKDVTVSVGDSAYLIGGLTGYTGKSDEKQTTVSNSSADISISAGKNSSRVGGLIGGGFFVPGYEEYFPVPTSFSVTGCTTAGSITTGSGCEAIGSVLGMAYLSPLKSCGSTMTISGAAVSQIGADAQLDALAGSYQQLFEGAVFDSKYNHYWHDYCAAIVGESQANTYVDMLKSSVGAPFSVIGSTASQQFNCGFYDKNNTGIARFTFDGTTISGYTANGTQIFSHDYYFVETDGLYADGKVVMPGFSLFETNDANAGEFKYFYMAPDTPAETFHIEFRYGSNLSALKQMRSGEYAYWLAAGILTDAMTDSEETMLEQVIALFCLENMDYSSARTAESLSQIGDITGVWDCDVSKYPEFTDLGIDALYCTLNTDGVGTTYARLAGTSAFFTTGVYDFFAYDNSTKDNSGVYVAHSEDEGAAASRFVLSGDGRTLSFTTLDGESIVYTRRAFSDVAAGSYYADAVEWAVTKGVTNGTSLTTFSPGSSCTRGQVVTFLWRAMGSPEPTATSSSFTDVDSGAYYYKAVLWATENGITLGTSNTTFSPNQIVTRAQAVTFQWRAAGSSPPAPGSANPFTDVASDSYYSDAVLWAVRESVTDGTAPTTFSPGNVCTRAQIVTFLYRQFGI